jgi:hypothetical protein
MSVERVGTFLEYREIGITPSLGLESALLRQCVEEVQRRGWRGVFGNPYFGFDEDNLDVLHQLPDLLQIWFWEINLKNVEGLYTLSSLRYFGVHDVRPSIDFSGGGRSRKRPTRTWSPIQAVVRRGCQTQRCGRLRHHRE